MTSGRAGRLLPSIVDVIGCTPMVELHRLVAKLGLNGRMMAKLEYLNPGFSKKDRIALEMIREAKASGQLEEGQPVVELTSGNTGTGLAIVCRAFGHPFIAVMSRGNTVERARMMRGLGAEVVLVNQAAGSIPNQVSGEDLALVEEKTQELVRERRAFRANQFELEANRLAHERHTGPEIWEQTEGQVDVFVDFAGTGGSFAGITRYLRSRNPRLRAYLVEPASAPALAGDRISNPRHKIQGGGYSMSRLPLLDQDLVTDYLRVTDEEAVCGARILSEVEGIFGGFSAGAHLSAALRLLQGREQGASIAFLVCDSGLKYLSTDLWGQM